MSKQTDKKWEKYFKGMEVETFVKANSSNTRGKSYLQVQNDSGNLINKVLLEHGHLITVFENHTYHYNGTFKNLISVDAGNEGTGWIHINCIDKVKDGKATFQIESTKLIHRGESIVVPKLNEQDNVPCKKFTSAKQLAASIIEGLTNEPSVPDYILEQVVQFFYDDVDADAGTITGESKFIWNAGVSDKEKNQLANYLGELLIGYEALLGNSSTISSPQLLKASGGAKLEYFAVPTDPAFSGIDSYLLFSYPNGDKQRRLISSKAGRKGADPSVWTNIMPHITSDPNRLNNAPTLKDLMIICKEIDGGKITGGKAMRYVYRYGVEKILGFTVGPSTSTERSKNPTINPDDLNKQLKAGCLTKPVYGQVIRKAIKVQSSLNASEFPTASSPSVLSSLKKCGSGMTSLFSRYIADKLNSEEKSKEIMRNTLIGRTIFQSYMDTSKFRKGEVFFTVKKITKADIHIVGGKAATNLISASQGTLNYSLIFSN